MVIISSFGFVTYMYIKQDQKLSPQGGESLVRYCKHSWENKDNFSISCGASISVTIRKAMAVDEELEKVNMKTEEYIVTSINVYRK